VDAMDGMDLVDDVDDRGRLGKGASCLLLLSARL
jgi:hypothetical protein